MTIKTITFPTHVTARPTPARPIPAQPLTYRQRELLRLVVFARVRAAYIARNGERDMDIFIESQMANPTGALWEDWVQVIEE